MAMINTIKRIELDLGRLEFAFAVEEARGHTEAVSTEAKALQLWKQVVKAFPVVSHVVLTGCIPRLKAPPAIGEFDEDYALMETVLRCSPPHRTVNVAYDYGNCSIPMYYTLWQVSKNSEPVWQVLDTNWTPTRILLPPRKFSSSPLGHLQTSSQIHHSLMLEESGIHWLYIGTYVQYALDGVIRCLRMDCTESFAEKSQ
jgi:hypothetical protein